MLRNILYADDLAVVANGEADPQEQLIEWKAIYMVYIYGLETMALTDKQQQKVQVCENNWIRIIVGVKRADKRRIEELRVKESVKKKLVRSS